MKTRMLAVFAAIAGAMGCAPNAPMENSHSRVVPFTSGAWLADNYSATFQVNKVTYHSIDTLNGVQEEAIAYTFDSTHAAPIAAGTVAFNTSTLNQIDNSSFGGGRYYMLTQAAGDNVPMATNGSQLILTVSGSSTFPSLRDTITYPNSDIVVTAPALQGTISKSSGFTASWNTVPSSTNTIAVQVIGDTSGYVEHVVSDNGSNSITSSELSSFVVGGIAKVAVTRIVYKDAVAPDGRMYVVAAYTRDIREVRITN